MKRCTNHKIIFILDNCCGSKPYYKEKQACCESSLVGMTVYTVADGCCYGKNWYKF